MKINKKIFIIVFCFLVVVILRIALTYNYRIHVINSGEDDALMVNWALSMMDGKKVIVTPGMIELGKKEKELNKEFGKQIADVCDVVILIGEKQTLPIKEGLLEKKFKEKDIYILNDVREAYTLINELIDKEDLYALFENDLPDTYTEK